MHASGSYILTVLDHVRAILDDSETDGKHSNDFLLKHFIYPAMTTIIAASNANSEQKVLLRHRIEVVEGTAEYQIPFNVQEVFLVGEYDAGTGTFSSEITPNRVYNPAGRGWAIENNEIVFDPLPVSSMTLDVLYTPSADVSPFYAAAGTLDDESNLTNVSTALGTLDRRSGAYVGQTLRVLGPNDATLWEDRIISGYNPLDRQFTTRRPFSSDLVDQNSTPSTTRHEVIPYGVGLFMDAVGWLAASKIAVARDLSNRKREGILMEYQRSARLIRTRLSQVNVRSPKKWELNTLDNPDADGPSMILYKPF